MHAAFQRERKNLKGLSEAMVSGNGNGQAKSEKGSVAVPLRRVDQVKLQNRDFLVPFASGIL